MPDYQHGLLLGISVPPSERGYQSVLILV